MFLEGQLGYEQGKNLFGACMDWRQAIASGSFLFLSLNLFIISFSKFRKPKQLLQTTKGFDRIAGSQVV